MSLSASIVPRTTAPDVAVADRAPVRSRFGQRALATIIWLTLVASLGITVFTGNAVLAILPPACAIVLAFVFALPLRYTVSSLIFAQCLFFAPTSSAEGVPNASGPLWKYFMGPGHDFMDIYLNKSIGLKGMSLTGPELLFVLLLFLVVIRILRGDSIDGRGRTPIPNVLWAVLALELAAVVWLEVWGAVNGGTMRWSLFQLRMFVWLPLETFVIGFAFRDSRDFRTLAVTVTAATIAKILIGWYFLAHDVWPRGDEAAYMTGHQDSVLYVVVLFCWIAAWLHDRNWQRLVVASGISGIVLLGIVLNNRRLAWVSLVATFVVFYPLIGGVLKRRIKIALIAATPLIIVYLMLARTHTTGIFAPGADLVGIANVADGSTQWRELENLNLMYTLRNQRIFGSGWGTNFSKSSDFPTWQRATRSTVKLPTTPCFGCSASEVSWDSRCSGCRSSSECFSRAAVTRSRAMLPIVPPQFRCSRSLSVM
jgi:hypothetical protein